jgi:hypothetical protein
MEKPKQHRELVEHVYWTCNRNHRHATEAGAAACMECHPNPPAKQCRKWTMSQILEVVALADAGESFVSIGKRYGLTGGRMAQIYAKGRRYLKSGVGDA